MTRPVIVVVGAGPGLGAAVARRFAGAGYDVGLIARSEDRLAALGEPLTRDGAIVAWAAADLADDAACRAAVTRLGEQHGRIDVLHFNPSTFRQHDPLRLTPDELLADVRLGAASLLSAVQAARPFLASGGRVLATGSMAADEPWHEAASLGVQKAALRNLVRSIDATLADDGVRAASLTVRGTLEEGTRFDPALVADALFALTADDGGDWRTEVPYPD